MEFCLDWLKDDEIFWITFNQLCVQDFAREVETIRGLNHHNPPPFLHVYVFKTFSIRRFEKLDRLLAFYGRDRGERDYSGCYIT